jgi:hypothetical protein
MEVPMVTPDSPEDPDAAETEALLAGRYRLLDCVGTGGMSRVHRAEDVALGRTVAIKLIAADVEDDSASRVRSEVSVLASLSHPSLVTLFDAHIGDGQDFLVMEFVDGLPLSQLLRDGALPPAEVALLAIELAEGLHAVHRAGIVHRDVKPSNVLLASTDVPGRRFHAKLGDFGIAYLLDGDRVTSPGLVMGTAAYLAPEQARGEAPTPAADIYALGLVLLEALSGEPAFPRATPMESAVARQTTRPTIPASVPPGWAALLGRMTDPDPTARPSAADVAQQVGRLRDGAPDTATVPLGIAGAAAAGAAAAGAAGGAAAADAAGAAASVATPTAATTAIPSDTATALSGDATTAIPSAATTAIPSDPASSQPPAQPVPTPSSPRATRRRDRRGKRALALVGAAAGVAALGLGAWALGNADGVDTDPTRTVQPAVESTEPPATPSEAPVEAPVEPAGPTTEDQEGTEEDQRQADEEARKQAEKAQKEAEKAQREAEKDAEEQAEENQDDAEESDEEAPAPTQAPPAPTEPAPAPTAPAPTATQTPAT